MIDATTTARRTGLTRTTANRIPGEMGEYDPRVLDPEERTSTENSSSRGSAESGYIADSYDRSFRRRYDHYD